MMKVCERNMTKWYLREVVAQLGRAGESSRAVVQMVNDLESKRSGRIEGALHRNIQMFALNLVGSKFDIRAWMTPNSKFSI